MNTKAKGSRRERQARDTLIEQGYHVTKAGASLGMFDLIAISRGEWPLVRAVQVKSNRWPRKPELDAIDDFAHLHHQQHVRCEIWRYDDGNKTPQIMYRNGE